MLRVRVRVRVKMGKEVKERSSITRVSLPNAAMIWNRTNPGRRRLVSDPMHSSFAANLLAARNQTVEVVDESLPTEYPYEQAACHQGKQEVTMQQRTKALTDHLVRIHSSAKNQEIPQKKGSQRKRKLPGSSLCKRREACDQNGSDAGDSETAPEEDNDADKPEEEENVSDASSCKWWSFTS